MNTLPNTPETEYLLSADILKSCKNVLLFNVGRGNIIKDEVLLEALEKHALSHAFLDVFEQEPLVEAHPFWQHEGITITPHIAAVSFPEQVVDLPTLRNNEVLGGPSDSLCPVGYRRDHEHPSFGSN